jgi:hypothetical protein
MGRAGSITPCEIANRQDSRAAIAGDLGKIHIPEQVSRAFGPAEGTESVGARCLHRKEGRAETGRLSARHACLQQQPWHSLDSLRPGYRCRRSDLWPGARRRATGRCI